MRIPGVLVGILLIIIIAQDGFETIVLPRRVTRKFRLARIFYEATWTLWSLPGRKMRAGNRREQYLSYFGPSSLILLLIVWACLFVLGFALVQWGIYAPINVPEKSITFTTYFYLSGTTFFTLGLGDITPLKGIARGITIVEAGIGFGFLALVIGYVPVIYQAFSHREINISLLDARAGSPPSAIELLKRHAYNKEPGELIEFMRDWERWSAELLESHLSYPVLTYYRSQHERQSWLAALTTILDTCALVLTGLEGIPIKPIKFTFAIARHAAVDLAQAYGTPPNDGIKRLSSADFALLKEQLAESGLTFKDEMNAERRLGEIRSTYEPFLTSLANHLLMTVPTWVSRVKNVDDWQTSAWDHFLDSTPQFQSQDGPLQPVKQDIGAHRKDSMYGKSRTSA